jgi:chorismate mutase/prephenate dehydratase
VERLLELREELDRIDEEIIKLYLERMETCSLIGDYKAEAGIEVRDPKREDEKLNQVVGKVDDEFHKEGIKELFSLLMSLSRELQYQKLSQENYEK